MPGVGQLRSTAPAAATKASWAFKRGQEIASGCKAVRSLGGGGMFEAFLAWDERRLCNVVCKLVRPDQTGDAGALRKLRREARMLARLAHPVIVRGLGEALDGPRPHIVLEHFNRESLRRRLRSGGPLPLAEVLPLALYLGAALHYLAIEGIVHLDVKPGNVLPGSPPRLIDLSVARTLDRARLIRNPVGTTNYMAPEQCRPGECGEIGPPADVWGLGVTLYEAIEGKLPFPRSAGSEAPDLADRFPQLSGTASAMSAGVPPEFAQLLLRCLAHEPGARPTAVEFVNALRPMATAFMRAAIAPLPAALHPAG